MTRNARGILQSIVAAKQREITALAARRSELREAALAAPPACGFASALRGADVRVIAEFKRRSPSAGWIRENAKVSSVIRAYEAAGAAALSILTDEDFFGGSLSDLEEGQKLTRLPVLRKDFVIDEIQLFQARAAGAAAALLIVRILEQSELRDLIETAQEIGLDALVEAHDAEEVEAAQRAGARVLGVNNRDLSTFKTDADLVLRVLPNIGTETVVVAESGVRDRATVERYGAAGVHAVLIGESLMREADPEQAARVFVGVPREARAVGVSAG
jgi:indole-3-glycerol phosphate synthase